MFRGEMLGFGEPRILDKRFKLVLFIAALHEAWTGFKVILGKFLTVPIVFNHDIYFQVIRLVPVISLVLP